jgi:hypothetical protein
MSQLLSGLRKFSLISSQPAVPETATVETPSRPSTEADLRFDRFRSHPDLIEVASDAPSARRIRFLDGSDPARRIIGEMPRGLSLSFLRLAGPNVEPLAIEWHPFGEGVRRAVFAGGDPLQPRITCGTRIRVHWRAQDYPLLRIEGYRWVGEGSSVHPVPLGLPQTTDAPLGSWVIPQEWLGTDPIDLRLTPLSEEVQGLTERLILPPRRLRVETVFQRVMLPVNGRHWRRLRVEVRVPPPLTPPAAVLVDWRPYDSGVLPGSVRRDWPAGETVVAIDLEHISLRGDRVQVRFEPEDGPAQPHAWFAAEESGHYAHPPVDVLLAEGAEPALSHFDYTHASTFPTGGRANLLTGDQPLPDVPGLSEAVADRGDWPATLVASYRDLAADRSLWQELRTLRGVSDEGLDEFARDPQVYLQYALEPDLRAIARRCGIGRAPFLVEQLRQAWVAERDQHSDEAPLIAHWAASGDSELDRWLGAVATGAAVGALRTFWFQLRWEGVAVANVLEAACQLEEATGQPLKALVPEVIPQCALAAELKRAVWEEARLPAVPPGEFVRIAQLRDAVLAALEEHWTHLLPDDADNRCRRIGALLRSAPAEAARELAALRRQEGPVVLKRGRWPVFEAERELAAADLKRRQERALRLRTVLHWSRTLLEHRMVPAWPWHGVVPAYQDVGPLLELWETIRPELPDAPANAPEPPEALRQGLAELAATAGDLDDDRLRALASSLKEHAAALTLWTR